MSSVANVVVLGSGMAGFGAAHHLNAQGIRPVIYDKASHFGGHTASFRDANGFLFDLGPHISFTKDPRIQALLARFIDDKYEALQVKLDNYWRGLKLTHPEQLHLNGLPHDLVVDIVSDFVKVHEAAEKPVANYEEWLVASYGRKFAELFPMQYTRKYHLTTASNMSTDWLGPRMYRPSLEEMLRGALEPCVRAFRQSRLEADVADDCRHSDREHGDGDEGKRQPCPQAEPAHRLASR